jgi:hypothetical protein
LVVHSDLAASRRVRVVVDHLVETFEQERANLTGATQQG